jgi:methanogenic corrinoid protein MtbC1
MVRKSRSVLNIGEGSINKKQLAKELERVVMDGFYDAYEGFVKKHLQRGVDPIDLAEMFMFATSQTSTLQNQIRKLRSITEKELRDARSGKEVMDIELSMDDPFMKKIMKGVEKGLRKK